MQILRKNNHIIYNILEDGFLLLLGIYLLFLAEPSTTWHFDYPFDGERFLLYILAVLSGVKLVFFVCMKRTGGLGDLMPCLTPFSLTIKL